MPGQMKLKIKILIKKEKYPENQHAIWIKILEQKGIPASLSPFSFLEKIEYKGYHFLDIDSDLDKSLKEAVIIKRGLYLLIKKYFDRIKKERKNE